MSHIFTIVAIRNPETNKKTEPTWRPAENIDQILQINYQVKNPTYFKVLRKNKYSKFA